jgi:carbohydrate-selective porin OprB
MTFYSGTLVRPSETMLEVYWAWSIYRAFLLTPDVQLYFQPALSPYDNVAAVFSLRLTQLF